MSIRITRCPRCGSKGFWRYGKERKCRASGCGHQFNIDDKNLDICELGFQFVSFTNNDVLLVYADVRINGFCSDAFVLKCTSSSYPPIVPSWGGMDYGYQIDGQPIYSGEWVLDIEYHDKILIQLSQLPDSGPYPVIKFNKRRKQTEK